MGFPQYNYFFPRYDNNRGNIALWLLEKRLIDEADIYAMVNENDNFDLLEKLLKLKIYPPLDLVNDIFMTLFENNLFDLIGMLLSGGPSTINLAEITEDYNFK
jgi:hypothetical protein